MIKNIEVQNIVDQYFIEDITDIIMRYFENDKSKSTNFFQQKKYEKKNDILRNDFMFQLIINEQLNLYDYNICFEIKFNNFYIDDQFKIKLKNDLDDNYKQIREKPYKNGIELIYDDGKIKQEEDICIEDGYYLVMILLKKYFPRKFYLIELIRNKFISFRSNDNREDLLETLLFKTTDYYELYYIIDFIIDILRIKNAEFMKLLISPYDSENDSESETEDDSWER